MLGPLVVLAVFAVVAGWNLPVVDCGVATAVGASPAGGHGRGRRRRAAAELTIPAEHVSHAPPSIHIPVTLHRAFRRRWPASCWPRRSTGCGGSIRTTPGGMFASLYRFLRPQVVLRRIVRRRVRPAGAADRPGRSPPSTRRGSTGWPTDWPGSRGMSRGWTIWIDRMFVDGLVNGIARLDLSRSACGCEALQTGNLRQYVMLIAVGTVALFVLDELVLEFRNRGEVSVVSCS